MNFSIIPGLLLFLSLNKDFIYTSAIFPSIRAQEEIQQSNLGKTKVSLNAASKQKKSSNGIEYSIILINTSSADARILNPVDFMNVRIKNEQGNDMMIQQASKYKINSTIAFRYTSLKILDVLVNDKSTNQVLDNETWIVVPKNSKFEVKISIPKIWQVNSKRTSYDDDQTEFLKRGSYSLGVSVGIGNQKDLNTIFLDPIVVQYGL